MSEGKKEIWQLSEKEVFSQFLTSIGGISDVEAKERLIDRGYNRIEEKKKVSRWLVFLANLKSPLILILASASLLSLLLGDVNEAIIILIIIFINALIGYIQENKAEKTIEALKKLTTLESTVIRGGKRKRISSEALVTGDVVLLEEGDKVPADGRIVESYELTIDESTMTGESIYIDKLGAASQADNPAEAKNTVFMGTVVTGGRGKIVITATGKETEFGKISKMVEDEFHAVTPLMRKIRAFSRYLAFYAISICFLIIILGLFLGKDFVMMFKVGISLAVSAIPEGLPIAITVILVFGVRKMAMRKAIIRKINSVETLGTTTVIACDKTGTLTHNKLMVTDILASESYDISGEGFGLKGNFYQDKTQVKPKKDLINLLTLAGLANNGQVRLIGRKVEVLGDATDGAILVAGEKAGLNKEELDREYPRLDEVPFSSERKYVATLNKYPDYNKLIIKGAFEQVFRRCRYYSKNGKILPINRKYQQSIDKFMEDLAGEGLRVLAVAYKDLPSSKAKITAEEVEKDTLVFAGVLGMRDSYRSGVKEAIAKCRQAGIKIIMLTGDHLDTAKSIGYDLGIIRDDKEAITGSEVEKDSLDELAEVLTRTTIIARMKPEIKYKIIEALKKNKQIVAMTGDGVNDVPALSSADIGIAMGVEGADAAKEAADMVLVDDNFSTIVAAVEEGRTIFENIRKTIFYLVSTSIGEVLTIFVGLILGFPLVLLPLQILWVNMVTDTGATIPLGLEPPEHNHLKKPPRKSNESILSKLIIRRSLLVGIVIMILALLVFRAYLPVSEEYARTMAFLVLVFTQWINSFSARSETKSVFAMNPFGNKALVIGIGLVVLVQIIAMVFEPLRSALQIVPVSTSDMLLAFGLSLIVLLAVEVDKALTATFKKAFKRK